MRQKANFIEEAALEQTPQFSTTKDGRFFELMLQPALKKRGLVFLAIVVFLVGLFFRLHGIAMDTPQPDEYQWLKRSNATLKQWRSGAKYPNHHLGHPGVPPSTLISVAEWITEEYNQHYQLLPKDPGYLSRLTAARSMMAVVSSLVFPVVFVGGALFLGASIAFLGSMLLVFSPTHLYISRLAHLDGCLTFFIVTSVICFALAERRSAPWLKLIGGMFWGLGIATKPIAGFILPAFLLYKGFRKLLLYREKSRDSSSPKLIEWSDLWAVFIGHLVFASIYTRLWQSNSKYVYAFHIENFATRLFQYMGATLSAHSVITATIYLLVVVSGVSLILQQRHRQKQKPLGFHLQMTAFTLGMSLLVMRFFPVVLANIARYWTWAAGLAGETHRSYGIVWAPPPFGYLELYLTKIPLLGLLGVACGGIAFIAILKAVREEVSEPRLLETLLFLILCVLMVTVWTGLLQVSSKQALRYAAPVLPFFFLFASFGLIGAFQFCQKRVFGISGQANLVITFLFASFLSIIQAGIVLPWKPDYSFFSNSFSGGIEATLSSGRPLSVAGTAPALKVLHSETEKEKREIWVMYLGDIEVIRQTYHELYPHERSLLHWKFFTDIAHAEYALIFPGFEKKFEGLVGASLKDYQSLYAYKIMGQEVLSLYKLPVPEYRRPLTFRLRSAGRNSGSYVEMGKQEFVYARPETNVPGYLIFGEIARVIAGKYRLTFPLLGPQIQQNKELGKQPFVRLEFGRCQRLVKQNEILPSAVSMDGGLFELDCEFDQYKIPQLRVYWFGSSTIYVGAPWIERRN